LCTFSATIEAQDRREGRVVGLWISGRLRDGTPLERAYVPLRRFLSTRSNWPFLAWGPGAIVHAGRGVADHLRAVVQLLSLGPDGRLREGD
jgi:hypothetical protein